MQKNKQKKKVSSKAKKPRSRGGGGSASPPTEVFGLYPIVVKDFLTELSSITVAHLPDAWLIVDSDKQMTLFLPHERWNNKQNLDPRWRIYGGTLEALCAFLYSWEYGACDLPSEINVQKIRENMQRKTQQQQSAPLKKKRKNVPLSQHRRQPKPAVTTTTQFVEKNGFIWV